MASHVKKIKQLIWEGGYVAKLFVFILFKMFLLAGKKVVSLDIHSLVANGSNMMWLLVMVRLDLRLALTVMMCSKS